MVSLYELIWFPYMVSLHPNRNDFGCYGMPKRLIDQVGPGRCNALDECPLDRAPGW